MPYFDGACYVYKEVIVPCLSLDPEIIVNWFAKLKQTTGERETILAEVEKYISENGTEALEKIIACKVNRKISKKYISYARCYGTMILQIRYFSTRIIFLICQHMQQLTARHAI